MDTSAALPRRPLAVVDGLLHPVTGAAWLVWVVNDHVLKGLGPGWLTGKLSDLACLMVVPWMPLVAHALVAGRVEAPLSRRGLWASCLVVGLVMVTINLFDVAAGAYRHGLAALQWPFLQLAAFLRGHGVVPLRPVHLTMDPTDVLTVVALLVPLRIGASPRAKA